MATSTTTTTNDTNWYQALCAKQQRQTQQPIPPPVTRAQLYARAMLDRPRGLLVEGIPVQLQFPLVTDTAVTARALNRGAPLGTDLVFTRVDPLLDDAPIAPGTALLALPGGQGTVSATLWGLAPNSKYQFTLTSNFRYNSAETLRVYRSTDVRNYPMVYTLWTHGPAVITLSVGRMLRFERSAVNAVRPGVREYGSSGGGNGTELTETVVYYLVLTTAAGSGGSRGDAAIVGPFTVTSVYAPPDVPGGATYTAEIDSVYTLNGVESDVYSSAPVNMTF